MARAERSPRLMLLTGEASGDRYGGLLAEAIRRRLPDVAITGIGGASMERAGVELLFDAHRIAVTGILEVAGAFGSVLAAWRAARSHLRTWHPDAVILIDYPDFNLSFARVARQAGIPVVYFVGPQVWAWRRYRVRRIARDVTRMLVILPFEERFYREHDVPATFVGHPLVDLVGLPMDRARAAASVGLSTDRPVLGLLPGSRRNEVSTLLPILLEAARESSRRHPGLQCVLPLAAALSRRAIAPTLAGSAVPVTLVEDDFHTAVAACHAVLVASGTATLEAALLGVPMVIAYRVNPWTYRLVRWLSTAERAGLPNLILGRSAVPECIQELCRPDRLAAEVDPLLRDTPERRRMVRDLGELRGLLGGGGAVERAAEALVALLRERGAVP